jgi:hypothetical protein
MRYWLASERGAHFVLLLGVGLILLFGLLEWRFPAAQQLQQASGRLEWQRSTRDSYYFGLRGEPRQFVLYVKGDPDQRLQTALRDALSYPVKVRFDPQGSSGGALVQGEFYPVYGVSVGGKEVVPLEVVRAHYRHDNMVSLGLGLLFVLVGGWRTYQCYGAVKLYRLDQLDQLDQLGQSGQRD